MNEFGKHIRTIIRWLWLPYAGLVLLASAAALLPRFRQLSTIALSPSATGQLTAVETAGLIDLGLSLQAYAWYFTLLEGMTGVWFLVIATFVYSLRRAEWLPLLFAYGTAGFGLVTSPMLTGLTEASPAWLPLALVLQSIALLCFILAILRFPNGRYQPPQTRWLGIIWTLYVLLALFVPTLRLQPSLVWNSVSHVLVLVWVLVWLGLIVAVQVVRYRRYSTPSERRQTRWIVWGLALGMGTALAASALVILMTLSGVTAGTLMQVRLLAFTVVLLSGIGVAGTFAVALLHSRLWDVDVVINRTLVYTLLTSLLALIYALTVVLLQLLLGLFGGEQTQLTVVVSTLLIAALFNPLRRHVQAFIDRRFYRRQYNAQRTLAHFGAVARDEVNLETLKSELLAAVDRTVQPKDTSLWLKDRQS